MTDQDALADALAARGHSRGDVLHLPELDGGDEEPGQGSILRVGVPEFVRKNVLV